MQDEKHTPDDQDTLDPAGPPVPLTPSKAEKGPPAGPMTCLLTVIAGSGALLTMCAMTSTQTRGSTRSAQIEWQQRRAQIEQAIAEEEAAAVELAKPQRREGVASDD